MSLAYLSAIGLTELLILGFGLIIPLIALVDVVRSNFKGQNDKIMWVLIIILFPVVGSLLYFFIGRGQRVA